MTTTLTSKERIRRMFDHQEADRVPITDGPWTATLERWRTEGIPAGVGVTEYFDLDKVAVIHVDNSPRYPVEVLEETDEWRIHTTTWGATFRDFKHRGNVPEHLGYRVTTPDAWRDCKARMTPDHDRVDWERLAREYPRWVAEGYWIEASFWFGFDVAHSWMMGTDTMLIAMATDPEWVVDVFNHYLDVDLALFEQVWDAGYRFDSIRWPDDMGYKLAQFFSLDMYRDLLKPVHARAAAWARERGVRVHLHSCGDIRPFVPDLIEIGIEMLNPLEVKAGVDPVWMKQTYGDRIGLHGGLNAVLYDDMAKMEASMRMVIPIMKAGGGYWISSDHSVPDTVSLAEFTRFVELAKELGAYE